ncbi:DUF2291 domain-containing protein [Larkinella punicea]|uniref:DUF2291 domain-containing protein n=1 Tax=Larkinella punicea TaxID=2315727 RepID=A0A368JMI6_9BACT|nr:DUF2291 domain-containing protein [Larkinella punicea]RCR67783.1 DUF2291 domain-containing protein [Larkinella punicea]
MNKPGLKYGALLLLLAVVVYHSVYFKKLDEVKAKGARTQFDATAYADAFWKTKLLPATTKATDLNTLIQALKTDKDQAFAAHSNAMSIGNIRYFLVKGQGKITAVRDQDVTVSLTNGPDIIVATEYIFGNAARDASGLISLTEFTNTMDLNNVSAEINQIIRKRVVVPFKTSVKTGMEVEFTGAIELNQAHLHTEAIEVIPISIRSVGT